MSQDRDATEAWMQAGTRSLPKPESADRLWPMPHRGTVDTRCLLDTAGGRRGIHA